MFNTEVDGCQNVNIQRVKVSDAGDSPNTDGIHVQLSSNVTILSYNIALVTIASQLVQGPPTYRWRVLHVDTDMESGLPQIIFGNDFIGMKN